MGQPSFCHATYYLTSRDKMTSAVVRAVGIGVIYGGTNARGVPVPPLFGLRGTVPPTLQDKKVKNLLSSAVNRGHLRSLNYNKTVFGLGSAPDPAGRAHDALPYPRVGCVAIYFLPILLLSHLRTSLFF